MSISPKRIHDRNCLCSQCLREFERQSAPARGETATSAAPAPGSSASRRDGSGVVKFSIPLIEGILLQVANYARTANIADADAVGALVVRGFEKFETRRMHENQVALLAEFMEKKFALEAQPVTVLQANVTRHDSIRMRLTAKEFGQPVELMMAAYLTYVLRE